MGQAIRAEKEAEFRQKYTRACVMGSIIRKQDYEETTMWGKGAKGNAVGT